jgi:hypothetical protein
MPYKSLLTRLGRAMWWQRHRNVVRQWGRRLTDAGTPFLAGEVTRALARDIAS